MDWSLQLVLKDCIAAAGVAATVAGIIAAVRVSRLKSRTHCDQQYFIEYSKRYQELISQAASDIRDPNFRLLGRQDYELVLRWTHAYFDMCFEQWFLGRQGYVSSRLWSLWREGMEVGFSRPAFQQAWRVMRVDKKCDKDFLLFVERLCSGDFPRVGGSHASAGAGLRITFARTTG
jgi:hypothetical protein